MSNIVPQDPRTGHPAPRQQEVALGQAQGAVAHSMAAASLTEIRMAMQMAVEFPRHEDEARGKILRACQRTDFAEKALYAYPRGGSTIAGPSIQLALEIGKLWKNMRWGVSVVMDTPTTRTVRAWAWDLENNTKEELDVTFEKKKMVKGGEWVYTEDERDLLELTNRNGSKGVRNAILNLLPWDLRHDAIQECVKTRREQVRKDPDAFKKNLIKTFSKMGVGAAELAHYVGKPLEQVTDAGTIDHLRAVYTRLNEGDVSWQEVLQEKWRESGMEGQAPSTAKDLRARIQERAQEEPQPARRRQKEEGNASSG